jgi:hypothetical protein
VAREDHARLRAPFAHPAQSRRELIQRRPWTFAVRRDRFIVVASLLAQTPKGNEPGWTPLFDSKTLTSWQLTKFVGAGAVKVENGEMTYLFKYFFTYAMPSAALCIALTAKLPPCSTKKCVMPDMAASGQIRV